MPASLAPLTAEECPILKRFPDRLTPVLAVYNRAAQVYNKLAAQFPAELVRPEYADSVARLHQAREELITPRFKVGFLGPFQCGKSTTLNNLLGTEISGTGAGEATTSVITRLVVGEKGRAPTLALRYFETAEYEKRRNKLCEWIRIANPEGRSESQLLELLKTHNPSRAGVSGARKVLDEDKPYLMAFLQSHEDHRGDNLVRGSAYTEHVRFEDKDRLLTHNNNQQGRTKASQYLLLSESEIRYHTDRIDPELELVDCPGLGSGRSVDDLLTEEYIPKLNGALVFLRADSMYSSQVKEILESLKNTFQDWQSRVWVIVNKMDAPDRKAKLEGDTQGKTTFDLITELQTKYGIPLTQVCLGCNDIYQLSRDGGGTADRDEALKAVKIKTADDERVLKERLAKYPALDAAFEEMLKDGSVSQLRTLIREQIGPSVAVEILKQAAVDASRAADDLAYALKQCEQPATEQEQKDALAWQDALYDLLSELSVSKDGERGELFVELAKLGSAARKHLEDEFVAHAKDKTLEAMSLRQLHDRFITDSERMQRELNKQFDLLVQSIYSTVTAKFDEQKLPPVTLASGREVMVAWQEIRQQDRDGGQWRERLRPHLTEGDLLRRLSEEGVHVDFDGPKYKKLILDKLRTASQQITLAVRGRLHVRLDDLRKQVSRKLVPGK